MGSCRRYTKISQAVFGAKVGLSRDQLTNIEIARVPLRFWPGWKICRELNLNPLWLLVGAGPQKPFVSVDLSPFLGEIAQEALFSTVCKHVLFEVVEEALEKLGVIDEAKAYVVMEREWVAQSRQRAKSLRRQATELIQQAEKLEAEASLSEGHRSNSRK